PGQRRHDSLGEILVAAAAADGAPRLDGQTVTVLVTVTAADLADPSGLDSDAIGTMAGSPFPVSRRTIERFIDAGGYRAVTVDDNGAVMAISSPQRCFTPLHRMGMAARDGATCITPGCTCPHYMLQAHHVIPDRDDGPTALDNGVLLCYWHHLIVDAGPWQYRMINGMPYVRGPGIPDWTAARKPVARAA
ncbi:MAG: HNH endonuclease signature motif containing protein, partial [Rhodoglobus sp.]